MNFNYQLKESIRGLSTAKLSTLASILTISLSLILLAVFYNISLNSSKLIANIKERVEIEIFLQDNFTQVNLEELKETLKRVGGVRKYEYVSKEDAARIFEEEFGREMLEVFESNPLPPSIKVFLYDEYKTTDRIDKMITEISLNPIVSDVIYPKQNLDLIEKNSTGIYYLNLIILIMIGIASIFLVSNTIRLVINSKEKLIEIYKLLGATKNFIRLPFILEGLIQGFLGGVIAAIVLYLFYIYFASNFLSEVFSLTFNDGLFIAVLIMIGLILGAIGSTFSVSKFLREKIS